MTRNNPYLAYLLLLIPQLLGVFFLLESGHNYSEIASRERSAAGIIVGHQPSNHNRYEFKFHVDGREYKGSETPLRREPDLGQTVTVYYDSLDPTQNGLSKFSDRSYRRFGPALALLVLAALFALAVIILGSIVAGSRGPRDLRNFLLGFSDDKS